MKKTLIVTGIVVGILILLGLLYFLYKTMTQPNPESTPPAGNEVPTPNAPPDTMTCTDRNKMCQSQCLVKYYIPIVGPAKWVECINSCKRNTPCKK